MTPNNTSSSFNSYSIGASSPTLHSGPSRFPVVSTYNGPSPSAAETCQASDGLQRSTVRPSPTAAHAAGARFLQRRTSDTDIARSNNGPPSASARERAARRFASRGDSDDRPSTSESTAPNRPFAAEHAPAKSSSRRPAPLRVVTAPQQPLTIGGAYDFAKSIGWMRSSSRMPAPALSKANSPRSTRARAPSATPAPPPTRATGPATHPSTSGRQGGPSGRPSKFTEHLCE